MSYTQSPVTLGSTNTMIDRLRVHMGLTIIPAVGGQNCAPPKEPWNDDSPVNTNQQGHKGFNHGFQVVRNGFRPSTVSQSQQEVGFVYICKVSLLNQVEPPTCSPRPFDAQPLELHPHCQLRRCPHASVLSSVSVSSFRVTPCLVVVKGIPNLELPLQPPKKGVPYRKRTSHGVPTLRHTNM